MRQADGTDILKDACAYETPIDTSPPDEEFNNAYYASILEQSYLVKLRGTTDRGNLDGVRPHVQVRLIRATGCTNEASAGHTRRTACPGVCSEHGPRILFGPPFNLGVCSVGADGGALEVKRRNTCPQPPTTGKS